MERVSGKNVGMNGWRVGRDIRERERGRRGEREM